MGLFGWWGNLHPFWRYGVAIMLLAISTGMYLSDIIWPWGWVAGAILLLLAGPSDSERKGYRF